MSHKQNPPHSCVRWFDPLLIAVIVVGTYLLCSPLSWTDTELTLVITVAVTVPMAAIEIWQAPWRRRPRPMMPLKTTLRRAAVRWLRVMAGLGLTLLAWAVLPEYRRELYKSLFEAMHIVLPYVPFVLALCILFTEWRMGPAPEEHTWRWGRWTKAEWAIVRNDLFGWLVRGIFLPINFCGLVSIINGFRGHEMGLLSGPWPKAEDAATNMIVAILVAAIVPGYLFGARLLGTEIKKVEQSWFGWAVTLACYAPLHPGVFGGWVNFYLQNNTLGLDPWAFMLKGAPLLAYIAGGVLLFLEGIHYWSEATFGLRSSNLSNRGIITNGLFRFCKHPVYLVKCISWALIWLPFMAGDTVWECFRLTLLWAGVCGIYFMRAWVEERLLSEDQDYVDYALWIDKHGLFSRAGRLVPALNYEWRLKRWRAQGDVGEPRVSRGS
ncbi:MAG: hypothetical protein HY052_02640 [Proteobacteria bacterium]|nr:hypothetical protein [Pseudomonadota bacterium]